MPKLEVGDYVKVTDQNIVIKIAGFTDGEPRIPDGFIIDSQGSFINPKFCEKYNGAISVLQ